MNGRAAIALLSALDGLAEWSGRIIAWFTLGMVLVYFAVVMLRYLFDYGSIAMQESVLYMHAATFLIGAACTLRRDRHVRVDLFYRRLGDVGRAWVNLLGSLLLLWPVAGFVLWGSWEYVQAAWAVREASAETGGLPYVYLLKSLIPVFALLLWLQGLAEIVRNALILSGRLPGDPQHPPASTG